MGKLRTEFTSPLVKSKEPSKCHSNFGLNFFSLDFFLDFFPDFFLDFFPDFFLDFFPDYFLDFFLDFFPDFFFHH